MATDINQKQRPELKSYFLAYSIPTQKNFEDLIDATIIEGEDPIAARPDSPLMIRVVGGHASRDEFLHFYQEFEDDKPLWVMGQNVNTENFEIGATDATRLSIGKSDGSLAINTVHSDVEHRAQLDVHTEGNEDNKSLVIAGSEDNYLSILSPTNNNAKVIIGGNLSAIDTSPGDLAKLHVSLNDNTVNPLVIEGTVSEDFLCIDNTGKVGVNIAVDSDFLTEKFNVRGGIKVGDDTAALYLKNDDTHNPTLFSNGTPTNFLKIISDDKLAFWAGTDDPDIANGSHLLIDTSGNVGIGFDNVPDDAQLAVNDSLYVGPTVNKMTANYKLEVIGNARIDGDVHATGNGIFNGGEIKGRTGSGTALDIYGAEGDIGYITIQSGKLGVGIPSPQEAVDVLGTVQADSFVLRNGDEVVPAGIIVMWSGAIGNIPIGWALCDGSNGPDLRGRFVMGYGGGENIGKTGGEAEVTLTEKQMPRHRHYGWGERYTDWPLGYTGSRQNMGNAAYLDYDNYFYYGSYSGGDEPHNNLPPYYVLAYIIKL